MNTGTKIALGVGGYLLVGAAVWAKKESERAALCAVTDNPLCHRDTPEFDLASTLVLWPLDVINMFRSNKG